MKNTIAKIILKCKKLTYSFFNSNTTTEGAFISHQPVVLRGKGKIIVGDNVNVGVINSPYFYNSYAYIEARNKDSILKFGSNIHINNGFSIVSEKKIEIEDEVLIGFNCHIIDSDFHNLDPKKRLETDPNPKEVLIKKNVFIGNNVSILKGITIGENSVVANGAVVTESCPDNVIIGGIPAKVIKNL